MPEIQQVRTEPWAFWQEVDYDKQDRLVTLYSLRCHNTSPVAVRIKLTLGRGANLTEQATIVQPGEDRTHRFSSPVNLRNADYGIAIEQV